MIKWIKTKNKLPPPNLFVLGYYEKENPNYQKEDIIVVIRRAITDRGNSFWFAKSYKGSEPKRNAMMGIPDYWISLEEIDKPINKTKGRLFNNSFQNLDLY